MPPASTTSTATPNISRRSESSRRGRASPGPDPDPRGSRCHCPAGFRRWPPSRTLGHCGSRVALRGTESRPLSRRNVSRVNMSPPNQFPNLTRSCRSPPQIVSSSSNAKAVLLRISIMGSMARGSPSFATAFMATFRQPQSPPFAAYFNSSISGSIAAEPQFLPATLYICYRDSLRSAGTAFAGHTNNAGEGPLG